MIEITEISPPLKLSGISSFIVQSNYNEQVIEAIKTCVPAIWHTKEKVWEVQSSCLSQLLDALSPLSEIKLHLYDERSKYVSFALSPLSDTEIEQFKTPPFKHQIEAVNYVLSGKRKYLNCFSMGVGKSYTAMITAETLHKRGLVHHCLVVLGVDSLRQQWKSEIKKFSNESVMILGEKISKKGTISYTTVPERCQQLIDPISEFFIIVNAATLRNNKFLEAFRKTKNEIEMIIVDECHKFATKTSLQGDTLLKLESEFKIAMTGTPIVNSPISIYVPLSFLRQDMSTLTNYKLQYCNFGGFSGHDIVGYHNLEQLNEEIANCTLRKTLDQVRDDMPAKNVFTEIIEMSPEHTKFYNAVKDGVKAEVDKVDLKTGNLLALTTRLRQATADPTILTTENILSSKIERCVDLVEELVEQNEKVVVLSSFKEPVYHLQKLLAAYNPLVVTGDTKETDAERNWEDFMTDPERKVLIGTHGKLGTGKNLNAASYMICLDEFWTAAQNNQSFDRIWRVNNTRPAFVTVLICKDTIDEHVHEIAQQKQELQDFMIDGKPSASFRNSLINILTNL